MNEWNILILSCGTRNKIVQYFKSELGEQGQVFATDCDELAPALYDADRFFIVPNIDNGKYLDSILHICVEYKIKAVLSLIDPELGILAKNSQLFFNIGVMPIVSDYEMVEMCRDKYAMYKYLTGNGYKTAKSYIDKNEFYHDAEAGVIGYPVFVKPVDGSASSQIHKVNSREEIELLFGRGGCLLIQEYMDGAEYGVDAYIDLISGEPAAVFAKEKIKMRAGETDKAVSVKDPRIFELVERFAKMTRMRGAVDIDLFKMDGEYFISEVNPRFGGGYPHAHACGLSFPRMIINNIKGIQNERSIGGYEAGVYMMKYNEVKIVTGR